MPPSSRSIVGGASKPRSLPGRPGPEESEESDSSDSSGPGGLPIPPPNGSDDSNWPARKPSGTILSQVVSAGSWSEIHLSQAA